MSIPPANLNPDQLVLQQVMDEGAAPPQQELSEPVVRLRTQSMIGGRRVQTVATSSLEVPPGSFVLHHSDLHRRRVGLGNKLYIAHRYVQVLVNAIEQRFGSNTNTESGLSVTKYLSFICYDASVTIFILIKELEVAGQDIPQVCELLQRQFTVYGKTYSMSLLDPKNPAIARLLNKLIEADDPDDIDEVSSFNEFLFCWLKDVLSLTSQFQREPASPLSSDKKRAAPREDDEVTEDIKISDFSISPSTSLSDLTLDFPPESTLISPRLPVAASTYSQPLQKCNCSEEDLSVLHQLQQINLFSAQHKKSQQNKRMRLEKAYKSLEPAMAAKKLKQSCSHFVESAKNHIKKGSSSEAILAQFLFLKTPKTFFDCVEVLCFLEPVLPCVKELLNYSVPFFGGELLVASLLEPGLQKAAQDRLIESLNAKAKGSDNLDLKGDIESLEDHICDWFKTVALYDFILHAVPQELTLAELELVAASEREAATQKHQTLTKSKKSKSKRKGAKTVSGKVGDGRDTNVQTEKGKQAVTVEVVTSQGASAAPEASSMEGLQQQLEDLNIKSEAEAGVKDDTVTVANEATGGACRSMFTLLESSMLQAGVAAVGEVNIAGYMQLAKELQTCFPILEQAQALRMNLSQLTNAGNLVAVKLSLIDYTESGSVLEQMIAELESIMNMHISHPLVREAHALIKKNDLPVVKTRDCLEPEFKMTLLTISDSLFSELIKEIIKWLANIDKFMHNVRTFCKTQLAKPQEVELALNLRKFLPILNKVKILKMQLNQLNEEGDSVKLKLCLINHTAQGSELEGIICALESILCMSNKHDLVEKAKVLIQDNDLSVLKTRDCLSSMFRERLVSFSEIQLKLCVPHFIEWFQLIENYVEEAEVFVVDSLAKAKLLEDTKILEATKILVNDESPSLYDPD